MNGSDKKQFSAIMAGIGEAFDKPVSKTRMALYFDALSDFSINQVEQAARRAIRELKFFPKAAELAEFAALVPRPSIATDSRKQLAEVIPLEERRRRHEEGVRRLSFALDELNRKFGTHIKP